MTDMDSGLVGWWKLNEGTGTSVYDSSGNGNTGTLAGSTLPTWNTTNLKLYNSDLSFNGTTAYVTLGSATYCFSAAPFSVAFWAYLNNYTQDYPQVISIKSNTTDPWQIGFSNQTNYLGVVYGSATTVQQKNGVTASTYLNTWTHIVWTYDGSNVTSAAHYALYVNGAISSTTAAGSFSAETQETVLAGVAEATDDSFAGQISDVRIYNRALSAADVQNLYNYTGRSEGFFALAR
jgi:hypothetical protein